MLIQNTEDYKAPFRDLRSKISSKKSFLEESVKNLDVHIYDDINEATKYFSSIKKEPINKTEEAFKLLDNIRKTLDDTSTKASISIVESIEFDQLRVSALILD